MMFYLLIGAAGLWFAGYGIGRVHGYNKYEEIERESKIWATK